MAYQNSFSLIGHGDPFLRYFAENQKSALARLLCDRPDDGELIYARHVYFMDLARFGCNVKYINMVGWGGKLLCVVQRGIADARPGGALRLALQLQPRGGQPGEGALHVAAGGGALAQHHLLRPHQAPGV